MPFDWEEFLLVAKAHINQNAHPCADAKDRCAISRAYYAAFRTVFQYIDATRNSPDIGVAGAAHKRLPRWLRAQPARELREIGEKLDRLRKPRHKADYEDSEIDRLHDVAYNAVCDSDAVLRAIDAKP